MTHPTRRRRGGDGIPRWAESGEFRNIVTQFHETHARYPAEQMASAKEKNHELMNQIHEYLQEDEIWQRVEYTGSSYEMIKTQYGPLEFDVMFIMKDEGKLKVETKPKPGYVTLAPAKPAYEYLFKQRLEKGKLSSKQTRDWFRKQLHRCVQDLGLSNQMKLREHGPACQIDVNDDAGHVWFSVDVVLAYQIGADHYVAKPIIGLDDLTTTTWRKSFSLRERDLISSMDKRDGGCRKQCARILKAIREKEPTFSPLKSYFIKTMLMNANKEGLCWDQGEVGVRLVDLMRRLSDALKEDNLEHAFMPGWNILPGYRMEHRAHMAARINRVLGNRQAMEQLLKT